MADRKDDHEGAKPGVAAGEGGAPDPAKPDPRADNDRFDIKAEAQAQKMLNAARPHNPNKAPRTNEPNAGGANREAGDRRG
ncbi:hypothetical protein [Pseudogemmobacter sonorensis]|uniref:hypothetical protein n=1 Tax=Pseudogemmobacter sonorensis TaxID=2989681 RepID=UPI0036819B60